MDAKSGGNDGAEYHDNLIDVVSIHQKIHHFFRMKIQNMADEEETDEISMNFDFYLVQAVPLLTTYQSIIKERGKIRFSSATSKKIEQTGNLGQLVAESLSVDKQEKDDDGCVAPFPYLTNCNHDTTKRFALYKNDIQGLVNKYLELVQQYFPDWYQQMDISALHKSVAPSKKNIPTPSNDASIPCNHENLIISHDNMFVCERCGLTPDQNNINPSISFKDINRVNLASKYLYDRITHFKDCINQFQGKQNCTIDKKVYENLLHQFRLHNLIPENYEELPREVAFQNITKEHIMLFLKECGHTKHYEDVVLIHSVLTGVSPPDITFLENQLLHDFDQLTNLYDKKYRQNDRKNFINTQYVLYQLLKRHKFPCKKEDFNILKTIDRKFYHDDICKSLFEELDWNFNPTF